MFSRITEPKPPEGSQYILHSALHADVPCVVIKRLKLHSFPHPWYTRCMVMWLSTFLSVRNITISAVYKRLQSVPTVLSHNEGYIYTAYFHF
jgi:hypothetical protein